MLEISGLEVRYGPVRALEGLDLRVDEGEIVSLVGANGAGKTTTLRAISGVRPVVRGTVAFRGDEITHVPPHELVKRGISQTPEGRGIFPGMSVTENLQLGAYVRRDDLSQDFERVYELFPILKQRAKQAGGTLSGGEQQMLAIGRALMARPALLLLDEPSMGLAPLKVKQIFDVISAIRDQGTTILIVEQNAVQALKRSDRAYVLERGRIRKSGPAADLLLDDDVRAAYLGQGTQTPG